MPTQTATPPMTLADAEAAKERLLEHIAAGNTEIDPMALVEADGAIRMARLSQEALDRRQAHEAKVHRLAAVEDLRQRLAELPTEADLRVLAEAVSVAVAELGTLADRASKGRSLIRRQLEHLVSLGAAVPDDVGLSGATYRDGRRRSGTKPASLAGQPLVEVSAKSLAKAAVIEGLKRCSAR